MAKSTILVIASTIELCLGHGAPSFPPSRQWLCSGGAKPNLGVQWGGRGVKVCEEHAPAINKVIIDWPGVARGDANGWSSNAAYQADPRKPHMDVMGGADATICSAGLAPFEALTSTKWKLNVTSIAPGSHDFAWAASAPHATDYYDVYITKDGWNEDAPLTWNTVEPVPICHAPKAKLHGEKTKATSFPCTVPARKAGRHVIFQIWQRSDSTEAFYACSDVQIGADTASTTPVEVTDSTSVPTPVEVTDSTSVSTPVEVTDSTSVPNGSTSSEEIPITTSVASSTNEPLSSTEETSACAPGYRPHPRDCWRFQLCNHGIYVTLSCPPGLHWNSQANTCDWPANANCRASGDDGEASLLP